MQQQGFRIRFLGAVLASLTILFIFWSTRHRPIRLPASPIERYAAANSTLGFGAIIPVSRPSSARREGLIFAANITGIDLIIPEQPTWTPHDVSSLRAQDGSTMTYGSSLAWLGHLHALKYFLSTSLSTALIIEDDVDWDIHLRTIQIPASAASVRLLTSPTSKNYWGPPEVWDILYLGHCGDFFPRTLWPPEKHLTFPDPTMPLPINLHPYTRKFLETLSLPPQNRALHTSIFPLCTFGYAITRASARRLVETLAAKEPEGGCLAYDVRIHEICRDYRDTFTCLTVNPELLHHVDSESEIAGVDDGEEGKGEEERGRGGGRSRSRSTPNIACSTRRQDLFTTDPGVLGFLASLGQLPERCLPDDLEGLEREMGMGLWERMWMWMRMMYY